MKHPTYPERWIVVKLTNPGEEPFEKVLAGWYGGYLGADEWRFSSLVETIVDKGDHYEFHNLSGSTYLCRKSSYGMSMLMLDTFEHFRKRVEAIGGKLEVVESYNPHAGEDNERSEEEFEACVQEGEDEDEEGEDRVHPL